MGMYEASSGFKKFGVLDGGDMTTEATLAKALVLGALDLEVEIFKKMLISPLCGEISRKKRKQFFYVCYFLFLGHRF